MRLNAFTLVELLVVVAIIVVLIAMLMPAMDKAVTAAEKAKCLVNQRAVVQGCHQYGLEQKGYLPPWKLNNQVSSSYDLRGTWSADLKYPLGLGLLPHNGYLPTTQLGKAIHCPSANTMGSAVPGIGMDMKWQYGGGDNEGEIGAGGSWWVDPTWTNERIISSYDYRSASYENAGKGSLRMADAGSQLIITIDLRIIAFGGQFIHPDGYNRVFGDGHGSFFNDPKREVDKFIRAYVEPNGAIAGLPATAALEERHLYPYLETQR